MLVFFTNMLSSFFICSITSSISFYHSHFLSLLLARLITLVDEERQQGRGFAVCLFAIYPYVPERQRRQERTLPIAIWPESKSPKF